MSFSEEAIRRKEQETRERLAILSMLLFEQALNEEELFDLGSYVLTISWGDVVELVNAEAEAQGLPKPDLKKLEYTLNRALEDYRAQVSEFEESPKEVEERMALTSWYVTWGTFDEAVLDIARQAGVSHIEWVTMKDSSVCPLCQELEGVYEINSAPTLPAHPACRCWWSLPTERTDAVDSREALSHIHEEYMKKIKARN